MAVLTTAAVSFSVTSAFIFLANIPLGEGCGVYKPPPATSSLTIYTQTRGFSHFLIYVSVSAPALSFLRTPLRFASITTDGLTLSRRGADSVTLRLFFLSPVVDFASEGDTSYRWLCEASIH